MKSILKLCFCSSLIFAESSLCEKIQYLFPGNNATWIVREFPVILRFQNVNPDRISNRDTFMDVRSERSGLVTGRTIISSDRKTHIFKPNCPYVPGEKGTVFVSRIYFFNGLDSCFKATIIFRKWNSDGYFFSSRRGERKINMIFDKQ